MSILSGPEILEQIIQGKIKISSFDTLLLYSDFIDTHKSKVGPNSVDLHLGPKLIKINDLILDTRKAPKDIVEYDIPEEGFVLQPGIGYLGHTIEVVESHGFVGWLDGRSSAGRLFLQVHQTAGRGDDGFKGQFTLELLATHRPIRVYAGDRIAQVSFFRLEGERKPYQGKYKGQEGPTPPKALSQES